MKAKKVSEQKATLIIENRNPKGLFFVKKNDGKVIGIDNSASEAFVEEFKDIETCVFWLENQSIEYYTENDFGKTIDDLKKELDNVPAVKSYDVIVTEYLVKRVNISAESESEALAKVEDMYDDEEIILCFDDFVDVDFFSD